MRRKVRAWRTAQMTWVAANRQTAKYVRRAILEHASLADEQLKRLLGPDYDQPFYLLDQLAVNGQEYPMLQWRSTIRELPTAPDETPRIHLVESYSPRLGERIGFSRFGSRCTSKMVSNCTHSTSTTSGFPFSTMYVASSEPMPGPTFLAVWIVPAGTNRTSPAFRVTGALPSSLYSSEPSGHVDHLFARMRCLPNAAPGSSRRSTWTTSRPGDAQVVPLELDALDSRLAVPAPRSSPKRFRRASALQWP